ncbi:MAG: alpha/beta fold hydrolase, partial [Ardenticatenaceae bacterium]
MPKVQVNEIDLYYEFHGRAAGAIVVFVNGLLTDMSSWTRHLPFFVEDYRCLLYDCRGQGQSDKPDHVYETAIHAEDLAELVKTLGIERAHVVGLSNGGAAALLFAADHPTRVDSLAVSGAYPYV